LSNAKYVDDKMWMIKFDIDNKLNRS